MLTTCAFFAVLIALKPQPPFTHTLARSPAAPVLTSKPHWAPPARPAHCVWAPERPEQRTEPQGSCPLTSGSPGQPLCFQNLAQPSCLLGSLGHAPRCETDLTLWLPLALELSLGSALITPCGNFLFLAPSPPRTPPRALSTSPRQTMCCSRQPDPCGWPEAGRGEAPTGQAHSCGPRGAGLLPSEASRVERRGEGRGIKPVTHSEPLGPAAPEATPGTFQLREPMEPLYA